MKAAVSNQIRAAENQHFISDALFKLQLEDFQDNCKNFEEDETTQVTKLQITKF